MVMKVKEPRPAEYGFLRSDLILFTYLHLAADEEQTHALLKSGVAGVAYETVQPADGSLPLLTPMSEVAGRMAVQVGAHYLEKMNGGRGKLLGGVPGVTPCNVVIIGGGVVGTSAAKIALGMGAQVTIIDKDLIPRERREDRGVGRAEHLPTVAGDPVERGHQRQRGGERQRRLGLVEAVEPGGVEAGLQHREERLAVAHLVEPRLRVARVLLEVGEPAVHGLGAQEEPPPCRPDAPLEVQHLPQR